MIVPGDGQGLQSTVHTTVMKGLTVTKETWERDVALICHQVFLGWS